MMHTKPVSETMSKRELRVWRIEVTYLSALIILKKRLFAAKSFADV